MAATGRDDDDAISISEPTTVLPHHRHNLQQAPSGAHQKNQTNEAALAATG